MTTTVAGCVRNGVVVPSVPLPEGAFVVVQVISGPVEIPPELREELAAWQQAGAEALAVADRLSAEDGSDAKR